MIQVLSVFFSLVFLLVTIYVVRRRELHFGYAILWLTLSLLVLVLALRVKAWNALAHLLGVYYAPALIFLVAILFVMVYLFQLTITVTRLSKENVQLAQEVAMLKGSTLLAMEAERGAAAQAGVGVQVAIQAGAQAQTGVQAGGPVQTGVQVRAWKDVAAGAQATPNREAGAELEVAVGAERGVDVRVAVGPTGAP